VHETTTRDTSAAPAAARPLDLVAVLGHPNGWRRDTAQRLLVERVPGLGAGERASVIAALADVVRTAGDWRPRLHALWTLDGLDAIDPALVRLALDDRSRDVRAAAVRIAERWLTDASHPIVTDVERRFDDGDWAVRHQVAASLGALPAGRREAAVVAFLERHPIDAVTMDAALSGLRGLEMAAIDRLLASGAESPQRAALLTALAAMVVRSAQDGPIQTVFARLADGARPAWERAAIMRGAEIAVIGGQLPGPPPQRGRGPAAGVAPPCPTCPGARGGPGGDYAFPGVIEAQRAARGGRAAGPGLRLNREPAALAAIASAGGDLGARAAAIVARVEWPGKPGATAAAPPLSPGEIVRFNVGREIYRNLCESCHQPDGRGAERIAPTLVGSALALADAGVPSRILLHGKEGSVGLMPPLGATMSDEDVAAVLTYVRREWGQTGTPVEPALVAGVRAETKARARPWTDAELETIGSAR
jgi:mono/diheme cytochrome c family protein